jgi:hypothetical protein
VMIEQKGTEGGNCIIVKSFFDYKKRKDFIRLKKMNYAITS